MKVQGRCHCGAIAFEAEVDASRVTLCHCTDCQTLTGTAYRTTVPTLPDTFVLVQGAPKIYVKTAESGRRREHGFCGDCGTPIFSRAVGGSPTIGLRVGSLTQRRDLVARRRIWCRSALAWSQNIEHLPQQWTE